MRSTLRKLHGLPISGFVALFRVVAVLGIVAVLLGRSAPGPAAYPASRSPAHPRYLGFDWIDNQQGGLLHLLDTETGALTHCPVHDVRQFARLSCSPWRDGEGQYHLIGPCVSDPGDMYGLVRFAFPAGRVLDRVEF